MTSPIESEYPFGNTFFQIPEANLSRLCAGDGIILLEFRRHAPCDPRRMNSWTRVLSICSWCIWVPLLVCEIPKGWQSRGLFSLTPAYLQADQIDTAVNSLLVPSQRSWRCQCFHDHRIFEYFDWGPSQKSKTPHKTVQGMMWCLSC